MKQKSCKNIAVLMLIALLFLLLVALVRMVSLRNQNRQADKENQEIISKINRNAEKRNR